MSDPIHRCPDCGAEMRSVGVVKSAPDGGEQFSDLVLYQCPKCKTVDIQ